jgi:uncharacterized protein YwqG
LTGSWVGIVLAVGLFGGLFLFARHEEKQRPLQRGRRTYDADRLRARLKEMVEPSLLLLPASEPAFSKLGGDPELPATVSWPSDDDIPRIFLAQVDLGEVRASGGPAWLAAEGRFFVFYDPDGHGSPDVVRVIYSPDQSGPATAKSPRTKRRFPEQRVRFARVISAPSMAWLGLAHHSLEDDNPDAWKEIAALVTAPPDDDMQHRIGGYPNEIQDAQMALICEHASRGLPDPAYQADVTPELERAADEWRLLIQIDSDPALKMNWGDGGRLYTFIRKADAQAGDFSKTVAVWQTY